MKVAELRELSLEELNLKRDDLVKQLYQLKFQHVTGQLENPVMIRYVRRNIASVKTLLNEKKREEVNIKG
ncbi:MAG: 50S ribosomal protein L29 [Thermodesulfobacteriota bacterium]